MTDVVVLIPMLGRPEFVQPLRASLKASTDRARIVWLCSAGDADVLDEVNGLGQVIILPRRESGDYAHKINVGVLNTTEPLIFTGASDIRFHRGWLEAAEALMVDGVEVVGTNDLCNPRTSRGHSTHTLMTRGYASLPCIDGSPGPLFTGYQHEMVDDELVATARFRGVYAHAVDSHVEHFHWMNGKRPRDAVDADHQQRMRSGRALLTQRKRMWGA